MENLISRILNILFTLPGIILALSLHEMCHGYVAHLLGDDTAKLQGRITLNPLKHIDPIGFLCLILVRIGWGKPVAVNSRNLKNPKRDMAIISLAGPVSNFLLGFVFSFLSVFMMKFIETKDFFAISLALSGAGVNFSGAVGILPIVFYILYYAALINVGLGVFNLIPVPPLDGSKILMSFLPNTVIFKIIPYEKYIQIGLFLLLFVGILSKPIGMIDSAVIGFFFDISERILGV